MRTRGSLALLVYSVCTLGCVTLAVTHGTARAQGGNLTLDGTSMPLSGIQRYDNVCLINGATLVVDAYDGGDKRGTGNLELIAGSIYIDATSKIIARGKGYQPALCSDGPGRTAIAGGRGGCSVMDSGGGGAHFGRGGRGTVDNPTSTGSDWQHGFPTAFEDDCNIDFDTTNSSCKVNFGNGTGEVSSDRRTFCWQDPLHSLNSQAADAAACNSSPCVGATVAGAEYWHNIYDPDFGAAGGDKGCRDGDGRTGNPVAGAGGGRVVLVALNERNVGASVSPCAAQVAQGVVRVDGTIEANGKRGCGIGNDSGGGGGGGTVLVVGRQVKIGADAHVLAAGGLGGDTNAYTSSQGSDCPADAAAQDTEANGGTCDDCGGGGGGGIITVLSGEKSEIDSGAEFNVSGALGGVCTICKGEAGGGAGELQLDGAYVGEYCDGYDNDFDGNIDEGLADQTCGLGSCAEPLAACASGEPVTCVPDISLGASCLEKAENARPRVAVVIDTSASMLLDLDAVPTFGDGSLERPGIDTNSDGKPNDSRLALARNALAQVISAYPEIDFSLARYHQDQGPNRSCQTAKWFECQGLVASYDNPADNTGDIVTDCQYTQSAVRETPGPVGSECINYAGSCGPPRRGADVLSGFGTPVREMLRWLDGRETQFNASSTPGDVCLHSAGNDCELRGSGPTPLAGSLLAVEDYVAPIRTEDAAKSCRSYNVILVTDGAESCNGDPVAAAGHLFNNGFKVSVVAVSVLPAERTSLTAIANAGGTTDATFVTQPEELVPALTRIIEDSIKYESCNNLDDDCDGKVDEDFPGLGTACDDHKKGVCRAEGEIACTATHDGTECQLTSSGEASGDEICNSLDDDCDGLVDEDLDCDAVDCTQRGAEICNDKDDDCDGKIDETDPALGSSCGSNVGECRTGNLRCVAGMLPCLGEVGPQTEQCNGKDDDCDGDIDDMAACPAETVCIDGACRGPCGNSEFSCAFGLECRHSVQYDGDFCVPSACALCKSTQRCVDDVCVDPCAGVVCDDNFVCISGTCRDCVFAGCPAEQVCYRGLCQGDSCATTSCGKGEFCSDGACVALCDDASCPTGQRCDAQGTCAPDACAAMSCGSGEACRDGQCATEACVAGACPVGSACVPALGCVPDACVVTACPDGTLCRLGPQGAPRCVASGPAPTVKTTTFISSGSDLTTCSVGQLGTRDRSTHGASGMLVLCVLAWFVTRRRHGARSLGPVLRWVWLAVCLTGCKPSVICLDCTDADGGSSSDQDSGAPTGDSGSNPDDGGGGGAGGGGAYGNAGNGNPALTCTALGDEVCNALDDDCDGNVDEDFDFMTNIRHCGGCDQPCQAANTQTVCEEGTCKATECFPGFADLDHEAGCEYRCPVFPAIDEDCNGVDDDCDGTVDEEPRQPDSTRLCRHTKGTPCENVRVVCATREQQTTWFCDYPDSVDFDPAIPDGIRLDEQRCDGLDNDCDGAADDPWPELGEPCDDGKLGACRDGGEMACTADHKGTKCDLTLAPDPVSGAGPATAELCNDLDDNCDGIVDNSDPADPKHIVDAMVELTLPGDRTYYIYRYEASRPDARADSAGIVPSRACSKPTVQPWSFVSYTAAAAACAASGKRLCTGDEWQLACEGDSASTYPYGDDYAADSCNGTHHDAVSGGSLDNAALPTGSLATCVTPTNVFDLSGNVKEWVNQDGTSAANHVIRGGSFDSPQLGLTCQTTLSQATSSSVMGGLGFRCCSDTAP